MKVLKKDKPASNLGPSDDMFTESLDQFVCWWGTRLSRCLLQWSWWQSNYAQMRARAEVLALVLVDCRSQYENRCGWSHQGRHWHSWGEGVGMLVVVEGVHLLALIFSWGLRRRNHPLPVDRSPWMPQSILSNTYLSEVEWSILISGKLR